MRTIRIMIEALIGGVAAAVHGAAVGVMVGAVTTVIYFLIRLTLSLRPFTGAVSKDIMSNIETTVALGAKFVIGFAILGAITMFFYAFGRIWARRDSFRRFLFRP
jgi:hypothetical protein